jgi:hypothetical protein
VIRREYLLYVLSTENKRQYGSFAYCRGVGRSCTSPVEVAFNQLDAAHRVAIAMTNVTLKETTLLYQKSFSCLHHREVSQLTKRPESVNPSRLGGSFKSQLACLAIANS